MVPRTGEVLGRAVRQGRYGARARWGHPRRRITMEATRA